MTEELTTIEKKLPEETVNLAMDNVIKQHLEAFKELGRYQEESKMIDKEKIESGIDEIKLLTETEMGEIYIPKMVRSVDWEYLKVYAESIAKAQLAKAKEYFAKVMV